MANIILTKSNSEVGKKRDFVHQSEIYYGFFKNNLPFNTEKAYKYDLKQFRFFLDQSFTGTSFEKVRHAHILAFCDFLKERDVSYVSINRKLTAINVFFEYLKNINVIENNPTKNIKRIRGENRIKIKTPALTKDEVKELFKFCEEGSYQGHLEKAVLTFMFNVPIRASELINLKMGNLIDEQGLICVKYVGKGNIEEVKPLNDLCVDVLSGYFEYCENMGLTLNDQDFIFRNNRGNNITNKSLNAIFKKYGEKIGKPFLTSHSAKTTVLTIMSEYADPEELRIAGSHSDFKMTMAYIQKVKNVKNSPVLKLKY